MPIIASPDQLSHIGGIAADLVRDGDRVGLGSGRAALAFVRALGARITAGKVKALGVPTSLLTEQVAREVGIPLATLDQVDSLDIAIDGADEVDPALNLTKGGGGNLTREKIIASITKRFVIVIGEEKLVPRLGTNFPVFVEVIEFARPLATRKITDMGARVEQRHTPDGRPFRTDDNNPYLQCWFPSPPLADANSPLHRPAELHREIRQIPGVVETGLFVNMASEIIIANLDGTVMRKSKR
ncbi:MAG: ribose-5-phosphate isomerase RpiA [Phycisphaerales bacterium]|nr:ribose-5-phosphate isomerase RpiA [Phycisphaerales bacterium]